MLYFNRQKNVTYPNVYALRAAFPSVSFPESPSESDLARLGIIPVIETPPPAIVDPWTERAVEGVPVQQPDGKWHQTWTTEPVTHTPEEEASHLAQAKAAKLASIDTETSAAVLAGFDYTLAGEQYHFSYDTFDQQNFADTANVSALKTQGVTGLPDLVLWNAYTVPGGDLVRLTFDAGGFLMLYLTGALVHKNAKMQEGGARKEAVKAATTMAEINAA